MGEVKRCAACGKENPVSEMKVCMHQQIHRYVCDSKCMTDFYNQLKKPTAAELEVKIATLEAENAKLREAHNDASYYAALNEELREELAKLRAELERRVPDGWKLVPLCVTSGMEDAYDDKCAEDGIEHELYMPAYEAMLAAAPSAPKADDPVKVQLLEALTDSLELMETLCAFEGDTIRKARVAIAAARQEGGK